MVIFGYLFLIFIFSHSGHEFLYIQFLSSMQTNRPLMLRLKLIPLLICVRYHSMHFTQTYFIKCESPIQNNRLGQVTKIVYVFLFNFCFSFHFFCNLELLDSKILWKRTLMTLLFRSSSWEPYPIYLLPLCVLLLHLFLLFH